MVFKTIELDVAQATLGEIIANLKPDEEVVIVRNRKPMARLTASHSTQQPRQAGNCKGMLTLAEDNDEHLQGFEEYMS